MENSKFNLVRPIICCIIVLLFLINLLPPPGPSREAGLRSQCKNNLKQIGLALYDYHDAYGALPPVYVADDNGRPMHSWRTLILPYLDQTSLYKEYRFDEPWNGPHNSQFLDVILDVYRCPVDAKEHDPESPEARMTSYVAVIGPRTAFPGSESVSFEDITDGTDSVVTVVEAASSGIHWMEPRDLHVLQMPIKVNPSAGQGISSPHQGGAHILMCDGSVRFISENIGPETIRRLIEIDDGEPVDDF